jgi:hypothetical protein
MDPILGGIPWRLARPSESLETSLGRSHGRSGRPAGAWKREPYEEIPADGSAPFEPLGAHPLGLIM